MAKLKHAGNEASYSGTLIKDFDTGLLFVDFTAYQVLETI